MYFYVFIVFISMQIVNEFIIFRIKLGKLSFMAKH